VYCVDRAGRYHGRRIRIWLIRIREGDPGRGVGYPPEWTSSKNRAAEGLVEMIQGAGGVGA